MGRADLQLSQAVGDISTAACHGNSRSIPRSLLSVFFLSIGVFSGPHRNARLLVALSPTGKSGKYIFAHRVRTNTDCTSGCAFTPFKISLVNKKPGHDTSELQAAPTAPEFMDRGGQVGLVESKVHGGGCEASSVQLQNCPAMKEDLSFYSTDTYSNTTSQGLLKRHFQDNRNSMTLWRQTLAVGCRRNASTWHATGSYYTPPVTFLQCSHSLLSAVYCVTLSRSS